MKSQPSAVIERPGIASRPVGRVARAREIRQRPNNLKLAAFTVKVAWAFASTVFLLVVVGLVLVVAGYAGSIFSPDAHPKALPASWPRK